MLPDTSSLRRITIRLGLILLFLLIQAPSALSSDPTPTIQNQSQSGAPAPRPASRSPRKRSQSSPAQELSRKLTEQLHDDRMPYVNAQVSIDRTGNPKSIVLTGQVETEAGKLDAENKARGFFKDSTVVMENRIGINPDLTSTLPRLTGHQNDLEIPQVGYISKLFIGCWSGMTAAKPVTWQNLSSDADRLGYHADHLGLCLTWLGGKLKVTDASAYDADPGGEMYGFTYKPISATGKEITLELKSWDSSDPNNYVAKGTSRCTLNPDDTITDFLSVTTFLDGKAAVKSETVAHLQREKSRPRDSALAH